MRDHISEPQLRKLFLPSITPVSEEIFSSLKIGIIANPSSGHDVRRLVSRAKTVTQLEKINLLRRVICGLLSMGNFRILYMPERLYMIQQALEKCEQLSIDARPVPIRAEGGPEDTLNATRQMVADGVCLIITLGGDGTNRLVAGESSNVPILPLSTGTNNIFPEFHEGSRAGLAAGMYLRQLAEGNSSPGFCLQHKCLKAAGGEWKEVALVDMALSNQKQLGGRAVWDAKKLTHVFASRATPGDSGISGLLGSIMEVDPEQPHGIYAIAGNKKKVRGFLVAGVLEEFCFDKYERMQLNEPLNFFVQEGILLVDGERVRQLLNERVSISLQSDGPWVLDANRMLSYGLQQGYLKV